MYLYGVIGRPVSHSISPLIMNRAFRSLGLPAIYNRYLLSKPADLSVFLSDLPIKGLNVTAPFKSGILPFATILPNFIRQVEAANTMVFGEKEISVFNTDIGGVAACLKNKINDLENRDVLILGAGGAARAAAYAVTQLKCRITFCNRDRDKAKNLANQFGGNHRPLYGTSQGDLSEFDIVINTIPVSASFFSTYKLRKGQLVLDADYKNAPFRYLCALYGADYIEGTEWLIRQAVESFFHFTGKKMDADLISFDPTEMTGIQAAKSKRIILTGIMGAGKSTIGPLLAKKLDMQWFDLDQYIEGKSGKSVRSLFEEYGEPWFRKLENKSLAELLEKDNIVISAGGGVVLQEENRTFLKKAHCIYIHINPKNSLARMETARRPLLAKDADPLKKLNLLLEKRLSRYLETADVVVNGIIPKIELTNLIYEDYYQTFSH